MKMQTQVCMHGLKLIEGHHDRQTTKNQQKLLQAGVLKEQFERSFQERINFKKEKLIPLISPDDPAETCLPCIIS
jgi:hypothetical protein